MISRANTAGMVATEGGAALALETDPELQFNEYTHDFVADKGCCTRIGLEGDDVDEFWFHTLRIFGLRKGYTIDTDLPGHYLLNTFGLTEEEEAVQAYSLPALLHPIYQCWAAGIAWATREDCSKWKHLCNVRTHRPQAGEGCRRA